MDKTAKNSVLNFEKLGFKNSSKPKILEKMTFIIHSALMFFSFAWPWHSLSLLSLSLRLPWVGAVGVL